MTREELAQRIEVAKAFMDNRKCQVRIRGENIEWSDLFNEMVIFDIERDVRIKPEGRFLPWKPEEVPVGATVSSDKMHSNRYVITAVWHGKIHLNGAPCAIEGSDKPPKLENVIGPDYEYSTDFGKTWQPCGVEE
jgi:hypothetical protein